MASPNVAILRFSDTTPAARPLLSISVARHLDQIEKFTGFRPAIVTPNGVTMSCRVHPDSAVDDPAAASRLDGGYVIDVATGEIISQFFFNGVADVDYIVTYLVTFTDGSREAFDAVISVRTFIGI